MSCKFMRCPSCGFYLAELYPIFNSIRANIYKNISPKYVNYDWAKLEFKAGAIPPLENVFNDMKVKNRCCRMRLMTVAELDKQK